MKTTVHNAKLKFELIFMTRKNKKLLFQMIDDLYNTREGKMKKKLAVFLLNTEKMKLYWIFLNATF